MKKLTFLTVIAVCFSVIAMIGCSSDSDPVTGSNLIVGDTSSETFQFISDFGDISMDVVGLSLDFSFDLLEEQFPSLSASKLINTKSTADTSIIVSHSYTYSEGWHIFNFSATFIEFLDTTIIEGLDSIQTLVDNIPVAHPDSSMNGLTIHNQYSLYNNNFGSSVGHQALELRATSFDSLGIVTVNGNTNDTLDLQFVESVDSCSLTMNNDVTISNVVFQIDSNEDCPQSGSIVANQNISLNCVGGQGSVLDSLNIDGNWTVTVAFHGATETITYSDGTTTWTVTEDCGPNMTAAAFSSFSLKE